jgi:hypothetical protein
MLEALVVRSVTVITPLEHPGEAGNVPVGASTLIVPVFSASAPIGDVEKSIV